MCVDCARRPAQISTSAIVSTAMNESLSSETAESERIARNEAQAKRTGWIRWLPGFSTLRHYESSWLRHDLVAGVVMTTMLVPVGIAYAEASRLPGINGLYATIVPLLMPSSGLVASSYSVRIRHSQP
jgi:sulfate permease family protein